MKFGDEMQPNEKGGVGRGEPVDEVARCRVIKAIKGLGRFAAQAIVDTVYLSSVLVLLP